MRRPQTPRSKRYARLPPKATRGIPENGPQRDGKPRQRTPDHTVTHHCLAHRRKGPSRATLNLCKGLLFWIGSAKRTGSFREEFRAPEAYGSPRSTNPREASCGLWGFRFSGDLGGVTPFGMKSEL
jgi:hypothetical protein